MASGGRSRSAATQLADFLQTCIDKKWLSSGKLLHARLHRFNLLSDTFLFNRLIELCSKCAETRYARQVFDQMPHRDIYSWNAMLGAYCKSGNLQDAHDLFEEMPERNEVSWNNLISAMAKNGLEGEALEVYSEMLSQGGLMPTRFTLASVFSACGALSNVACGRKCHGLVVKIGLEKNVYVGNALLSMYAKCGFYDSAVRAFGDVPDPNEVSITAIMGVLARKERIQEAMDMFKLMCRQGIRVDSVSLSNVLGFCTKGADVEPTVVAGEGNVLSNMALGQQLHGLSVKLGFEKDLHLTNSLLDMYAKNGDVGSAEAIFGNLVPQEVSVVTWNVMIAGYGQKSRTDKAILLLQRMRSLGFEPDDVTYINMLTGCVRSGDIRLAREMFDSMSAPTLNSWNAMISCYFQSGHDVEALKLFRAMQFQGGVRPDRTTLAVVLSSCAALGLVEFGRQIHAVSLKGTSRIDVYVSSGLVSMYSKCGRTDLAREVFGKTADIDIVCWNSMMAGLALNCRDSEAFTLFKKMQQNGFRPTQFSYTTILSCLSRLPSSSFHGRQIQAQVCKDGHINDLFVGSALIGVYCKFSDIDGARRLFDAMSTRNTVTWNEMIHGYAQSGHGQEAVSLYQDMIDSDERPDSITFVAVLTACNHRGMVDKGLAVFDSMQRDHGVEPGLDHYTCIVDCLGRAGRFCEAEDFIDRVPNKDDPILWEVLLSSCRVHGNLSLFRRAADELLRLDPRNSTPYVLLANMYASMERWEEARAVRELMGCNQIGKNPGYSWIDINGRGKERNFSEDDLKAVEG